ncbi:MAG TPA: antibiotic biosynthesis monooxygenase [Candidatus Acidoferrales bacterium]|nr:antibiotic biosynthesis monooxygenase [Candidatus Acidoferrales bacterium]
MYCYVWSFVVRPEHIREFEDAYGPEGGWARFFRNDPEYIRTHLLCDREKPARYVTVDFWSSYEAWASFRKRFASQFEALDKTFEQITIEEEQIGSFNVLGESGLVIPEEK